MVQMCIRYNQVNIYNLHRQKSFQYKQQVEVLFLHWSGQISGNSWFDLVLRNQKARILP